MAEAKTTTTQPEDKHINISIPPPESRGNAMVLVWKCTNCGHIFHLADTVLPETCPSCNKPKSFFEQVIED